jgi:hypothetical protein
MNKASYVGRCLSRVSSTPQVQVRRTFFGMFGAPSPQSPLTPRLKIRWTMLFTHHFSKFLTSLTSSIRKYIRHTVSAFNRYIIVVYRYDIRRSICSITKALCISMFFVYFLFLLAARKTRGHTSRSHLYRTNSTTQRATWDDGKW